ncbi:MAG: hypothetical protein CSA62_06880 [Planctomycetota bacterium]|nr:MAG: hypothetical protein CSA62_06880 [Planctomycetota bacterium]
MSWGIRVVLSLLLLMPLALAQDAIVIEGLESQQGTVFLTQGQRYEVRVPVQLKAGERLHSFALELRPGSQVAHIDQEAVQKLGEGRFAVTPSEAALAKLIAAYDSGKTKDGKPVLKKLEMPVSIQFSDSLPLGFFVMLLAGIVLFGGAALSIRTLLSVHEPGQG